MNDAPDHDVEIVDDWDLVPSGDHDVGPLESEPGANLDESNFFGQFLDHSSSMAPSYMRGDSLVAERCDHDLELPVDADHYNPARAFESAWHNIGGAYLGVRFLERVL